ncbi:MAG: phage tail tape measure protein [Actinobacteria bacterium]|nr:phage tail tape measure protein [Actinomycetota bacterium]
MADRSVKVTLTLAAQGFMSGMDAAAQKTATTGTEIEKLAQKKAAFQALGTGAFAFGTAMGAGVALAISKFAEFDQQMSSVQAATHETSSNMAVLREAALDAGESTVFSATEAAGAIEELSKAGVSTANILSGGLAGSLDLAAAGQLDVARSAEITSTALNQFGLAGDQASHVADVLAAGAGKAMGSVDDLAQGLKFVGPVASAMGVSLEETTGVLAMFAQKGIIGEQAGTSLRGVLSSLTAPSAAARGEIERLGLTLYDSQGNFLGMQNAAGQLSNAYANMDGASRDASLGIIFGRETITAATALYQAGAAGVDEWTRAVDDSGYAAETARARLDNLAGDVEALGGALDTALIQTGSGANGVLREMVQGVSFLVGAYNDLPEPVQTSVLLIGAATAAVALSGGAAMVAVPKWAELRATVSAAGLSMSQIALRGAGAGVALAGLGAVIGAVIARQGEMRASAEEFADTLDEQSGAVTDNTRQMIAKKLADQGVFDQAEKAGVSQKELTDALYEGGDAAAGVIQKFKDASFATGGFDIGLQDASRAVDDMNTQLDDSKTRHEDYRAALEGSTAAVEESTAAQAVAAQAAIDQEASLAALSGAAQSTETDINALADAIRGFGSAQLDVRAANRDLEASFDDLQASIKDNGTTLDVTTAAGRANETALDDLAKSTLDLAAATVIQTNDQNAANGVIANGRQRLIDMLGQFGITGQAAEDYADNLGLVPDNISTAVGLTGVSAAEAALNQLARQRTAYVKAVLEGVAQRDSYNTEKNEAGGLYERSKPVAFEAGGFASGFYAGRPGAIHKFAEQRLPWELYVSPAPEHRARNQELILEGGRRLGMWDSVQAASYAAATTSSAGWSSAPAVAPAPQLVPAGIQPGDQLQLVVGGQKFDAYVEARAGAVSGVQLRDAAYRSGVALSSGSSSR